MIKKVAAIQTSDGSLYLDPDEARKHEFRLQLYRLLGILPAESASVDDCDDGAQIISVGMLVEKMDDLRKILDESTNIVVGAQAL